MRRPQLRFADAPHSLLDETHAEAVVTLLREAARLRSTTMLCVSHHARLFAHADRRKRA